MQDSLLMEYSLSYGEIKKLPYDRFYIMAQNLNEMAKKKNENQPNSNIQPQQKIPNYKNLINKTSNGSKMPKVNIPKY